MRTIRIRFDGGTSCNIPRLGYGNGYGSYQIDNQPIYRCSFNVPMSANAAEIRTLVHALQTVAYNNCSEQDLHLEILGDSRIALKWAAIAAGQRKRTKIGKTSHEFQEAVSYLEHAMKPFRNITTRWTPRLESVAVFGH